MDKHSLPRRRLTDDSPEAEARRMSLEVRMQAVEDKLAHVRVVEDKIDANTKLTQDIVDLFKTLEAGIRVLGGLGRLAKWAAPIVALGATIWSLMHGRPPSGH